MIISGRYSIIEKVGEGGMQEVFRANDTLLGRQVAVKRAKNASADRRFKRSAVLSARVNHPNVAKTLDYVEEGSQAYLVEEFIDGFDLSRLLEEHMVALDPDLVARLLHHIVKGVSASHAQGVVHRDLKPSNVMISGGLAILNAKVTDFGIAKMAEEEITREVEGGNATMTTSKTVVGAIPYMAPEAIETPREVSLPADIWSLGAMAYELVYGKKPFGTGLLAVKKITAGKPPELPNSPTANPQFTPAISEIRSIIEMCLQPDAQKRPTAKKLAEICSGLCYAPAARLVGTVAQIRYRSWGFIQADDGAQTFFHLNSVYGPRVSVGDKVLFAKYDGLPAPRAFPVLKLKVDVT